MPTSPTCSACGAPLRKVIAHHYDHDGRGRRSITAWCACPLPGYVPRPAA